MKLIGNLIKGISFFRFIGFYIWKLIQANAFIAYDILTPKLYVNPGFVNLPLRVKSDFSVLLLSNLISMTPGTLSIDIVEERDELLVHYLYGNEEKIVEELEAIQEMVLKLVKYPV